MPFKKDIIGLANLGLRDSRKRITDLDLSKLFRAAKVIDRTKNSPKDFPMTLLRVVFGQIGQKPPSLTWRRGASPDPSREQFAPRT